MRTLLLLILSIPAAANTVTYSLQNFFTLTTADFVTQNTTFYPDQLDSYTFTPTSPNIHPGPVVFEMYGQYAHVVVKYSDDVTGTNPTLTDPLFQTDFKSPGTFYSQYDGSRVLTVTQNVTTPRQFATVKALTTVTPEPATFGLIGLALVLVGLKNKMRFF